MSIRLAALCWGAVLLLPMFLPLTLSASDLSSRLRTNIGRFGVDSSDAVGALQQLALRFDIPIGIECARQSRSISFEVDNATIADVLDRIVSTDGQYRWEVADGVVNVVPRASPDPILETKISRLLIRQTDRRSALAVLETQSEVRARARAEGVKFRSYLPGVGSQHPLPVFPLDVRDETVRSVLGMILRDGRGKYWVFSRYADETGRYVSMMVY